MTNLLAKLRAKRFVRERWVEPVGTMDEPCDSDDDGAEAILRNPDGPEAADKIESLMAELADAGSNLVVLRSSFLTIMDDTSREGFTPEIEQRLMDLAEALPTLSHSRGMGSD